MNPMDRNHERLEDELRRHFDAEAEDATAGSVAWWSDAMAETERHEQSIGRPVGGRWLMPRLQVTAPLAAALALAVIAGAASLWAVAPWEGNEPSDPGTTLGQNVDAENEGTGPISPGGEVGPSISTASCVEVYSLKNLKRRAFAFDGTVASIETRLDANLPEGDQEARWVTFTVNEWFKGGDGAEVGVWLDTGTVDDGTPVQPGSRLLVTGEPRWGGEPLDDPIAWVGCGFTQGYDPEVAAAWAQALVR